MKIPVVFFIFRRPELTARVFEAIRQARPADLLVIADGPRDGVSGEAELVLETRAIVENVDWPCDVEFLFSEKNLGLRQRILTGLDCAFEKYERAIILEDDCVPSSDFFAFVSNILERYSDNPEIALVAGSNFAPYRAPTSFHFSSAPYIWGWGTWRRVWNAFRADQQKETWSADEIESVMATFASKSQARSFRSMMVNAHKLNTWDVSLAVWIRLHKLLSVVPKRNLVENIGFGADATHTLFEAFDVQVPLQEMQGEPIAPDHVRADSSRERRMWMRKRLRWLTFPLTHPLDFLGRFMRYFAWQSGKP